MNWLYISGENEDEDTYVNLSNVNFLSTAQKDGKYLLVFHFINGQKKEFYFTDKKKFSSICINLMGINR